MENTAYWFCETNNLILIQGLYDNESSMYINALDTEKSLIMCEETPVNPDAAATTQNGSNVVITMPTGHGFEVGDWVHIQDTKYVDGTFDIKAKSATSIEVEHTFTAETLLGTESVFREILGGGGITGSYIADSDGNWKFVLPATAHLRDKIQYIAFIVLTHGGYTLTLKVKRKAIFYPKADY